MWNDRYADHAAVRPNTLEGHFDGVGQKSGDRNQQAGGLPVSKIATRIARRQLRQKQEEERANGQRKADEHYMRLALQQARRAQALGEVPIGCVIVKEGQVIARGYNRRNTDHNTLSHAELNAIRKASRKLQDWRLEGCTIYITLEPCQMCSGAIVQSRIDRCVVGAMNPKAGCAGSVMNLLQVKGFNHQVDLTTGILEEACSQMLSEFFQKLRQEKQEKAAGNTETSVSADQS